MTLTMGDFIGAASLSAINRPRLGISSDRLPQAITLEIGYRALPDYSIWFSARAESDRSAIYGLDIALRLVQGFSVSAGYQPDPSIVRAGAAVSWLNIRAEIRMDLHADLGWSRTFVLAAGLGEFD